MLYLRIGLDYGASVTFLTAVTKYLTRSNVKEEELILVSSLRRDVVHCGGEDGRSIRPGPSHLHCGRRQATTSQDLPPDTHFPQQVPIP